jgi:hypothetical protein
MNESQDWEALRERFRLRWPALTDKELDSTNGQRDMLIALVEMRLGYAHANAAAGVDAILGGEVYVPEVADATHHTGSDGPVNWEKNPEAEDARSGRPE